MRRLLVAFGLMGGVLSPALAADFDALPASVPVQPIAPLTTVGPATFTRWSGFYGGGTFSYGHATTNFSGATQPLVAYSLRGTTFEIEAEPSQLPVLGNGDGSAFGYGGFLGYNTQWQDLVIGFEANYTHTSLNTTASPSPVGPLMQTVAGATYNYNISGTGNLDLTDYASIRGRAGWVIGNLLPYGFAGVAIGRANYNVTSTIFGQQITPTTPPTVTPFGFSNSAGQSNALLYGYSVGLGLDWALTPNLFLRSEFEFVQFVPLDSITVNIISARAGAGLKF
jgi:opacity protein-like surface antigen